MQRSSSAMTDRPRRRFLKIGGLATGSLLVPYVWTSARAETQSKNDRPLVGAIGYVTPADKLAGRDAAIFAERDRKLAEARERRARRRQEAREDVTAA